MTLTDHQAAATWPREPGSGRGRSHGTSGREPFDRWFRYPAGFASDYVYLLIDRLGLTSGTVVDCFAGSGVTGTAARSRGLGFVGIEAHPLIAELAELKLRPVATGTQVRRMADLIATIARHEARDAQNLASEPELVRRSFEMDTLKLLIALRSQVKERLDEPASLYLKWALLGTLRDVAAVKVGWPYQRPGIGRKPRYTDPISRFKARAELISADLDMIATNTGQKATHSQIVIGDSRDPSVWAQVSSEPTACIASPPYLNNFDYADATRLELFFWGDVVTWGDMCREVRSDMLTATTQQSSVGEMKAAIDDLQALKKRDQSPVAEVLEIVQSMTEAKFRRERRSKEYDQVAPAYFLAMSQVLDRLFETMQTGGTAMWLVGDSAPYGVYVDTPRIIGEFAELSGFTFSEDVLLRVRGNRWQNNADRHQVPLAERLIVFHKGER